jgi:hypothetical protein
MEQRKKLTFEKQKPSSRFELVYYPKDSEGSPMPHSKSMRSDNAFKIWQTWINNQGPLRKKKKKKDKRNKKENKERLPTGQEAKKLLLEAGEYAEKQQLERN